MNASNGPSGNGGEAPIRRVLAIGVDGAFHARAAPLLRRRSFDADRVPAGPGALQLVRAIAFDVLVIAYPLLDPPLGELLAEVRRPGAPCRRAAVILVAAPADVAAATAADSGEGFLLVIASDADEAQIQTLIAALLRVAPRLSVRIPIRLEVRLEGGASLVMSQTENVSLGGMLVRVQRQLPAGVEVAFQLMIPSERERITGTGRIVRAVADADGRATAVGVRFESFRGRGESILADFLTSHTGHPATDR